MIVPAGKPRTCGELVARVGTSRVLEGADERRRAAGSGGVLRGLLRTGGASTPRGAHVVVRRRHGPGSNRRGDGMGLRALDATQSDRAPGRVPVPRGAEPYAPAASIAAGGVRGRTGRVDARHRPAPRPC